MMMTKTKLLMMGLCIAFVGGLVGQANAAPVHPKKHKAPLHFTIKGVAGDEGNEGAENEANEGGEGAGDKN
jgi:hypothetical protein